MCGLTMVVNKNKNGFSQQQQDVFNTLFYLSGGYRGRDGAGVVIIDSVGNVKIAKQAGSVDLLQNTKEFAELDAYAFQNGWAMIGHNRAATRGNITDNNSHPFIIDDNIVLVHNGTFNGDHKHLRDTEVDSEAIGHVLSETEDIEEALRKINAAYALIWYNVAKRQLNVVRNSSRPLYYMETANSYIYSSELDFLEFAINRFKLKVEEPAFLIHEHNLGQFTMDDKGNIEVSNKDIDVSYYKHNTHTTTHSYPKSWASSELTTFDGKLVDKALTIFGKSVPCITNKVWDGLKKEYPFRKKLKIVITEAIEANDDAIPTDFLLMGRTVDKEELPALCIISNISMQEVVDYLSTGIFEVEVSCLSWRRIDEVYPVDTTKHIDEWPGTVLLHTKNPVYVPIEEEMKVG